MISLKAIIKICLILLAVAGFFLNTALAKGNDIRFQTALNTGAYNNSIMQDRDGFLWIGCSKGIIRYDGYDIINFKAGPGGLSSSYTPGIFEDDEGLLWIGSVGGGLNVFDKKDNTFKYYKNDPGNPFSLNNDQFNWAPKTIAQGSEGFIWIGTIGGLSRFDKKTQRFKNFSHDPKNSNSLSHNSVWTIMPGENGLIWIGTDAGLDVYDKKTNTFTRYAHDPKNPQSIGKGKVYAIEKGEADQLWIGTSLGGLNRFDLETKTFKRYVHDPDRSESIAHNEVYSITRDSQGVLWLGRSYAVAVGLERFDPEKEMFSLFTHDPGNAASISGNIIMGCYEDRSGILWVVENTGSIDKYDKNMKRFDLLRHVVNDENSLSSNVVPSISEDSRGYLWLSTQLGGLNRYDRENGEFRRYKKNEKNPDGISNNYIFSVLEDRDRNLWVAMNDGVHGIFDPDRGVFVRKYKNPFADAVARGMIEDRFDKNILWFGTESNGFFMFEKDTGRFRQYVSQPDDPKSLSVNIVTSLFQDEKGNLWVPTQGGGLDLFNRKTQTFSHFKNVPGDPSSISGNTVVKCYIDSLNNFWVSTVDGGLNKFYRDEGRFKRYGKEHGFTTKAIKAILEDGQQFLWMGSDKGLIKFDIKTEKVVQTFDSHDGLQGDNFSLYPTSAMKTRDGQMWFAGLNGVSLFYPPDIVSNGYVPPVALISIHQGENNLSTNCLPEALKNLHLNWNNNSFEFEFVALNYSQPEKNQYAYFLEGFEEKVNYIGNRRYGKYTNIPGGKYILKLYGSNNDGVWNYSGASLEVHVETKPWKSWWAFLIYGFFLVGTGAFFYWRKFQSFEAKLQSEKKISAQLRYIDKVRADLIEKQKGVEEELLRNRDILETMVAQRTEELERAIQEAEEASHAKGRFLANMSHEIRTPLNLMLGFSQALEKDLQDETQKEYISLILSSGKTLLTLLNDLLDLSKIESGKFQVAYQAFDIHRLLVEIHQMFAKKAQMADLSLELDIDDQVPKVVVLDEIRLRQILVNIIGNAIKFTNEGGVTIRVDYFSQPGDSRKDLVISVEDTGVGIAYDQQENIFKVFSQQQGQDHNKYGGTGLGLTISKRLVEIMGGRILLESSPGRGSRFVIQIENIQQASSSGKDMTEEVPGASEAMSGKASNNQIGFSNTPLEEKNLSLNEINQLKQLIEKMEIIKEGTWANLKDAMVIDEIKLFADELQTLSATFDYTPLGEYGKKLGIQADKFDMEQLPATLNGFSKVFKTLEDTVKKNEAKK